MTQAEIVKFQGIPTGDVTFKRTVRHPSGKKCSAFTFAIEVKRSQFKDGVELSQLFDGNPVHIAIENQSHTASTQFPTVLERYHLSLSTQGDERIPYFKIEVVAYRRNLRKADNLFDLWCEDFLYFEVAKLQRELAEFAPVRKDKNEKPDPKQQKLDILDDAPEEFAAFCLWAKDHHNDKAVRFAAGTKEAYIVGTDPHRTMKKAWKDTLEKKKQRAEAQKLADEQNAKQKVRKKASAGKSSKKPSRKPALAN